MSTQLSLSMLAVFVIACIFLFVAVLIINGRAHRDGTPETDARRRRSLLLSLAALLLGLLLAAPPTAYLLTLFFTPAAGGP